MDLPELKERWWAGGLELGTFIVQALGLWGLSSWRGLAGHLG